MSIFDALASGRLPNLDAVLQVRESTIAAGRAAGSRAIDVTVWDGIACRIYPDRGLDIGQAWHRGVPLAWVSSVGEAAPLRDLGGMKWGDAFGGGLVTTCGLRNVGMPSEGHGLHGTFSHLPASNVKVERVVVVGFDAHVAVSGVIDDPEGPSPLRLERTIRVFTGTGRIELEDVTTNLGERAVPAPLLYHVNLGYPLWAPPALLEMPVAATQARDAASEVAVDSWDRPPEVVEAAERVLEHELEEGAAWGWARLTNPSLGAVLTIRWDRSSLPRLNQWLDTNPGMSVLGIEPANCTTRGVGHDLAAGLVPFLDAGEQRKTQLAIEAEVDLSGR